MSPLSKRDEIILQAFQVFYKHGFHASGVDSLLADSGISKRTLYKYFSSKEELIEATIEHYRNHTLTAMVEELTRRSSNPKEKLLAIFDIRREALEAGDYSGCFAINAKLEYEGRSPDIEAACAGFLNRLEQFIGTLCIEAKCKNPETMARQIMLILEGTIIYGQSQHDPEIAIAAKEIVKMLLKNSS